MAVREFASHPAVELVAEPTFKAGVAQACFAVAAPAFGAHWFAVGHSPTGALPKEGVVLDFPAEFPLRPPKISLRPDFSRNHPHIQPWLHDGRVVPCVVEGGLDEFIVSSGFRALADQVVVWLDKAATGALMQADSAWEPARRDSVKDQLFADATALRKLVGRKPGHQFLQTDYVAIASLGLPETYYGNVGRKVGARAELHEGPFGSGVRTVGGRGMAVAVWAGIGSERHPNVVDEYLPDDFRMLGDLWARAERLGAQDALKAAMGELHGRVVAGSDAVPFPVIFLVRRPSVVEDESDLEILPYITLLEGGKPPLSDHSAKIRPLSHRHLLSPKLLQRLSGTGPIKRPVLLGAGSLGSKVGLHLARAGNPPIVVADNRVLQAHNAARHALIGNPRVVGSGWLASKADALAEALSTFGTPVRALADDHAALIAEILPLRSKPGGPEWLIDTTASEVVRHSLARAEFARLPRVAELSLQDAGRIGVMAIEGPGRNPNVGELGVAMFQYASQDDDLRKRILAPDGAARIEVGQGCGSLTMPMSDATLSVMAAAMAEITMALGPVSTAGFHLLSRRGVGLDHVEVASPPFERIAIQGEPGWTVSLSADVSEKIQAEMARYPNVETGGILVGRSSMVSRTFVVTDLIDAPTDSRRSRTCFELGVSGLREAIEALSLRSAGLLRVLGTWHSHLGTSRPSGIDRATADAVGAGADLPMTMLIVGTDGARAIPAFTEDNAGGRRFIPW